MAWAANPIRLMLDGARRKSQRRGGGGIGDVVAWSAILDYSLTRG